MKPTLASLLLGGPGHDGYAYNADVYCVGCGRHAIRELYAKGKYDDGDSGDTDQHPQPIFFGESDTAQMCESCGDHLYGPLDKDDADEEDEDEDDA